MPAVSGDYDPDIGILLRVGIHAGGALRAASGGSGPSAMPVEAHGLVDTGASLTAISLRLVRAFELQPSGRAEVQGVTGAMEVDTHIVDLVLRFGTSSAVAIENFEVCEFEHGTAPFDAIIGRDILCQGVLTTDFAGRFTFSV